MNHPTARGIVAAGFVAVMSLSSFMPAASASAPTATTATVAASSNAVYDGEYAPMDHNLYWIPWDDTIYRDVNTCMRRGGYLAARYTDIVSYQCRDRYTVNVVPRRYGVMLEVKRP